MTSARSRGGVSGTLSSSAWLMTPAPSRDILSNIIRSWAACLSMIMSSPPFCTRM